MTVNYDHFVPVEQGYPSCQRCPVSHLSVISQMHDIPNSRRSSGHRYTIEAKRHILKQGVHSQYLFTLHSGWAVAYQSAGTGSRYISHFVLPGDLIGFPLDDSRPIHYSVQAITDIEVCAISRENFYQALNHSSTARERLFSIFASDLNRSQRYAMVLARRSAEERLAYLLLDIFLHVRRLGKLLPDSTENSIMFPPTHGDLADATGLTGVHVGRTVRSLTEKGFLTMTRNRLTLHDRKAMMEFSGYDQVDLPASGTDIARSNANELNVPLNTKAQRHSDNHNAAVHTP